MTNFGHFASWSSASQQHRETMQFKERSYRPIPRVSVGLTCRNPYPSKNQIIYAGYQKPNTIAIDPSF